MKNDDHTAINTIRFFLNIFVKGFTDYLPGVLLLYLVNKSSVRIKYQYAIDRLKEIINLYNKMCLLKKKGIVYTICKTQLLFKFSLN